MVKVRHATWEDSKLFEVAALDYAKSMNRDCEFINVEYAATKSVAMMFDLGCLLICEKDERDVGLVGAIISPSPFNPDLEIMCEMLWWTHPAYRNCGVGAALLEALEIEAEKVGINQVSLSLLDTSPDVTAWLSSKGYMARESNFIKSRR